MRLSFMADNKRIYDCLTPEQQRYYDSLTEKKRKYVDARAQNYNKAESYRMAGFEGDNAPQSANNMERRDAGMAELIKILQEQRIIQSVDVPDSQFNCKVNALAKRKEAQELQAKLENMSPEEAERIKFYRDIATGVKKEKQTTLIYDKHERLVSKKVVVKEDIGLQMQARKEFDKLLGLNQVREVGSLSVGGNVNIMIVNASNEDELKSEANKVDIDFDENEVIIEHVDGDNND